MRPAAGDNRHLAAPRPDGPHRLALAGKRGYPLGQLGILPGGSYFQPGLCRFPDIRIQLKSDWAAYHPSRKDARAEAQQRIDPLKCREGPKADITRIDVHGFIC